MNVLIIQSPLVQLNTAYPSGAYLSSFFKKEGCNTQWYDLSIELFYEIFSRKGLNRLFDLCSEKALKMADKAEQSGDEETAFNLRRYVSQRDLWCDWIEIITSMLHTGENGGGSYENAHRFIFGAHVPRGSRMESYMANLDHDLTTDDGRSIASFALADLADFITAVFDSNFSLIRYAESLTVSENSFVSVEKGAYSPIMTHFYKPVLESLFDRQQVKEFLADSKSKKQKTLICISVPFAGTFAASLATGNYVKNRFGNDVYVSMGGGFINTELRQTQELLLNKYCDVLSYDRGYGSYHQLLQSGILNLDSTESYKGSGLYNMRQFTDTCVIEPAAADKETLQIESHYTATIIPDFTDIDFTKYPRLIDDKNPMHRLWSDGAWIKVYMAHGCYWHQCAFCDVTLDYVKSYCMTDIKKLYEGILAQCQKKGIYGIHFVDEAMPPVAMMQFAKENIAHGSPITWWGNIRFEKVFTRDVTDYLSAGGLIGVSAGLESATGSGLDEIHKGTNLNNIVSACCAFKESGILVHAYMIYGYWKEKPQDLINSMETLRQFYTNGLLDSSFWHKFVLTRHSRVYKEYCEGKFKDLKPLEQKDIPLFAKNGMHFEGEKSSEKYGNALDYSLNQWMHGKDLDVAVNRWFDFSVPKPTVGKDFIANLIEKYEQERDRAYSEPLPENKKLIVWLGGKKIKASGKIAWTYMGEYYTAGKTAPDSFYRGKGLCVLPPWPGLK